jgi:hypothetical protein
MISFQLYSHSTMNTLYEYVSKDLLPKEYGGYLNSLATYHSKCNAFV